MSFKVTNVYYHSDSACGVREFICDSVSDVANLPRFGVPGKQDGDPTSNEVCAYGSIAIVCDGSVTETYILTPNNEWTKKIESQSGGTPGVTSWNDLTDKPFYHISFSEVVIDNLTKEDHDNNNRPSCTFIPGDLYTVIWNGTYYENIKCYVGSYGYNIIQDPDVFYINDGGGDGLFIVAADQNNDYTVSVIHHVDDLQKLDEKFIPDTIARKEDIEQHVTYWDDLEDKPFYDTGIESLTWDGDTTDKQANMLARSRMYKISDEFIPPELMLGATVTFVKRADGTVDTTEINETNYTSVAFNDKQSYIAFSSKSWTTPSVAVVHSDEYYVGYNWTRGVYISDTVSYGWYISEIKFNSTIKPLDEKYLPSTIPNIEEVQQMINDALGVIENGTY